jgi:hypothetical protein
MSQGLASSETELLASSFDAFDRKALHQHRDVTLILTKLFQDSDAIVRSKMVVLYVSARHTHSGVGIMQTRITNRDEVHWSSIVPYRRVDDLAFLNDKLHLKVVSIGM